ncbi:hypothetical protein DFJ74DRAFT_715668 [Hyaloraphidium curvatum]|nr:hypothetical protein DFJ74DRAFT_715668 [Hyaloraphidium curvatum]
MENRPPPHILVPSSQPPTPSPAAVKREPRVSDGFAVPLPRIPSSRRASGAPNDSQPLPTSPPALRYRYTPLRNFLAGGPRRFAHCDPRAPSHRPQGDPFPLLVGTLEAGPAGVLLVDSRPEASVGDDGGIAVSEVRMAVRLVGAPPVSCWDFAGGTMAGRRVFIAAWNWVPAAAPEDGPTQASAPGLDASGYVEALVAPQPVREGGFLDTLDRFDFAADEFDPLDPEPPPAADVGATASRRLEDALTELLAPTQLPLSQIPASQLAHADLVRTARGALASADGVHGQLCAKSAVYWTDERAAKRAKKAHGGTSGRRSSSVDGQELPWFFCRLAFGPAWEPERFVATVVVQTPHPIALHAALEIGRCYVFRGFIAPAKLAGTGAKALVWKGGTIEEVAAEALVAPSQAFPGPRIKAEPDLQSQFYEPAVRAPRQLVLALQVDSPCPVSQPSQYAPYASPQVPQPSQYVPPSTASQASLPPSSLSASVPAALDPDSHLVTFRGVLTSRMHPRIFLFDRKLPLLLAHRARKSDAVLEDARDGCTVEARGVHALRTPLGTVLAACTYTEFRILSFPARETGPVGPEELTAFAEVPALYPLEKLTGVAGILEAARAVQQLRARHPRAPFLPAPGASEPPPALVPVLKLLGLREVNRDGIATFAWHDGGCPATGGRMEARGELLSVQAVREALRSRTAPAGRSEDGREADAAAGERVPLAEADAASVAAGLGTSPWLVAEVEVDGAGRAMLKDATGTLPLSVRGGFESAWFGSIVAVGKWTGVCEVGEYVRCSREDVVVLHRDPAPYVAEILAKAGFATDGPTSDRTKDWLLYVSDVRPVSIGLAKTAAKVRQTPWCRVEGLAVPVRCGTADLPAPLAFRWDLSGNAMRFRPIMPRGSLCLATGLLLDAPAWGGGPRAARADGNTVVMSLPLGGAGGKDVLGQPSDKELADSSLMRLREVEQHLRRTATDREPRLRQVADVVGDFAHPGKVLFQFGMLQTATAAFEGIVVSKEFRLADPTRPVVALRGQESMFRYGVGTGEPLNRVLCITLRDLKEADTVTLYLDCSNQEWPADVLPGWHVRVVGCAFRSSAAGKVFAYTLPAITAVEAVCFVPAEEQARLQRAAALAKGPMKLADWLLPANAGLRTTALIRCRIRNIWSASIGWKCRSCTCQLFDGTCPQGCEASFYTVHANASCTVYDGTAEATVFMDGVECLMSLLRVRGVVAQKLQDHAARAGEIGFSAAAGQRNQALDGSADLHHLLEPSLEFDRTGLRPEERLLVQCCMRHELVREVLLRVRRYSKPDADGDLTTNVTLGTVSLPLSRGPRLMFKALAVEDVDYGAEALRLVVKLS